MANMRTRIATDLHDDIGANLTRIALLSEVASRTPGAEPGGRADGPLSSIARIARESVSSMSDIVWAINPKRESLLDLTRRMRQHAEEVFTLRDIDLRFNGPSAADSLKLGMDVRRDLLLVFKEAVNNCARHSRCERVEIDLHVESGRLVLTVVDQRRRVRSVDAGRRPRPLEHGAARSQAQRESGHHVGTRWRNDDHTKHPDLTYLNR